MRISAESELKLRSTDGRMFISSTTCMRERKPPRKRQIYRLWACIMRKWLFHKSVVLCNHRLLVRKSAKCVECHALSITFLRRQQSSRCATENLLNTLQRNEKENATIPMPSVLQGTIASSDQ